jgi:hypothetical protein
MIGFVDNTIICGGLLRRFGPVYLMLIACVSCAVCCPRTVLAQQSSKTSDQPDKASVQNLLDELDDIDVGRYVTPLKLSAEQIDKVTAAIADSNSQYDKKIMDLRAAGLAKMTDEIHTRHKETLAGDPASKEFDDKVRTMLAEFNSQKEKVYYDAIAALATACGKILTADQKKVAALMEKDMFAKLGKKMNPANTDDQYLAQYVLDVFINYRRIVPLLKAIKPAA